MESSFIWTDLSAYDLLKAQDFYTGVLGWQYQKVDPNYDLILTEGQQVGGIYPMPKKFMDMGMPSFWMSYIWVENVAQTVEQAQALGAIIELTETGLPEGNYALIRDPAGAGFTVYDDQSVNAWGTEPGTMVWNELVVSSLETVRGFYETLFQWQFNSLGEGRYQITDAQGTEISALQVLSNSVKGKFEYWAVFFGVKDLDLTIRQVEQLGGELVYREDTWCQCNDPFGAMFCLIQV